MNNLARILLLIGAVVLALLVGVLIGRSHKSAQIEGNSEAVQINTAPPPMAAVIPLPPPAPLPAPAAPIAKVAPDQQVQEDAAAVGMTTKEDSSDTPKPPPSDDAAGNSAPAN